MANLTFSGVSTCFGSSSILGSGLLVSSYVTGNEAASARESFLFLTMAFSSWPEYFMCMMSCCRSLTTRLLAFTGSHTVLKIPWESKFLEMFFNSLEFENKARN